MIDSGYSKVNLTTNRYFNLVLASVLLVLSSPLMLIIALIVKLQDGQEVFYKGERLGINKIIFIMYKFRTMMPGAEQMIRNELLTHKHRVVTQFGKILRDSRLDELPQLLNIIKGDMDFVGPRPERPVIYEEFCRQIKFYDKRFSVKPGLIGYSQLFTPHSAPKEIRAFVDNHFLNRKQSSLRDIRLILYTMFRILFIATKVFLHVTGEKIFKGWVRGISEHREMERIQLTNVSIKIVPTNDTEENARHSFVLKDINEEAFRISTHGKLDIEKGVFMLQTNLRIRGSFIKKRKSALCYAELYKKIPSQNDEQLYVFKYDPISPLNAYKLHQYFLSKSIS